MGSGMKPVAQVNPRMAASVGPKNSQRGGQALFVVGSQFTAKQPRTGDLLAKLLNSPKIAAIPIVLNRHGEGMAVAPPPLGCIQLALTVER